MFDWLAETKPVPFTVRVPGKLFVAGEYAILEPGNPAILFAVNQYLSCTISDSEGAHDIQLFSELASLTPLKFNRKETVPSNSEWRYVLSAIHVVEQLVVECQRPLKCYQLHFATELIDTQGAKYGLGSSGAVTVATIKALLTFYGMRILSPEMLFRLAAIALIHMNATGSLADIAANCYGGWIFYQALDRTWLAAQVSAQVPLSTLLTCTWPHLVIESLNIPSNLQVHIGWTASPASTDHHVQSFNTQKSRHSAFYQQFVRNSAQTVLRIKDALEQEDWIQLQQSMRDARHQLLMLDHTYHLSIETPMLKQLIALAEQHNFVAKSSGAGGGDCGIALGQAYHDSDALLCAWRHAGIIPLSLGIAPSQTNE